MKNFKSLLSLCVLLASSFGLAAQYAVAMASTLTTEKVIVENIVEKRTVNKEAVQEISEFIAEKVSFPFEELTYSNQISLTIQVAVNELGEIIDTRLVSSDNPNTGKAVLKALESKKQITPILINGKASSQTLQIPITFQ